MAQIFVNLKRFEVPRRLGGICPNEDPQAWMDYLIEESIELGLGSMDRATVTYLLPEALLPRAKDKLDSYVAAKKEALNIGCQGVFREDIVPEENFGAFTTNLPATSARHLGATWSIIGHSEERADKTEVIEKFLANTGETDQDDNVRLTVNQLINAEVRRAMEADIKVVLCVGEKDEERGGGTFEDQKPRIKAVLRAQLLDGLNGLGQLVSEENIVVGYEPIWAIGPGKSTPGKEYVSFVSDYIKQVVSDEFGFSPGVVYGGGLKEENAPMMASIDTIDGGLVGLTKFTGEIAFEPDGLKKIIERYLSS